MSNKQQEPSFVVRGVNGEPITVTPTMLAGMSFGILNKLRDANEGDKQNQNLLGNYEHRAFTREFVESPESPTNPVIRAIALGAATPVWDVAKRLPRSMTGIRSRSEPSFEQVKQGMIGIGEGLANVGSRYGERLAGMMGITHSPDNTQQAASDISKYATANEMRDEILRRVQSGALPAQYANKLFAEMPLEQSAFNVWKTGLAANLRNR